MEKTMTKDRTEKIELAEIRRVEASVRKMDDFTDPAKLYEVLCTTIRGYHPSDDISMIEKAYKIANEAHKGQVRKSGEPYIIHPLCVGIILADLEMDKETITAGLLHDVVEDTVMTYEEIASEFSVEIANLVDGVTKLGQLSYKADKIEIQAENLRKMFLAMAKDIRVIIIKLADRLHNMRTLQYMRPEKQKEKARETMDIYSPIAQRLGISKIKVELDDLALKYLQPDEFYDLVEKIALKKAERERLINGIIEVVGSHIRDAGIEAQINGRIKHLFSIYKKMKNQNKSLEQIYDMFAVRIIVRNIRDCYAALGVIHAVYKPIPGRFKDYISMPKSNGYQSLHTTLIGSNGTPFEIQIRTFDMHRKAEYGIAAHWKYKEESDGKTVKGNQEEEKLNWLKEILEWQRDTREDSKAYMAILKNGLDLFTENVYCFTPEGDVKELPVGSTPIDFAYSVHSAVGNKMVGARVNGKLVTIDYVIQTGDRIEIITSQNSKGPSRDWLNIVKTAQAKNKINQWFKQEFKEENIERGKEMFASYCKTKSIVVSDITKPEYLDVVMRKYGFRDWDSVMAAIGHGGMKEGQVVNRLLEEYKKNKKQLTDKEILENKDTLTQRSKQKRSSKSGIIIRGTEDLDAGVRLAKCCSPVPGDEIVGYITRGRGITVHRTDCVNIINLPIDEQERLYDVEWQAEAASSIGNFFSEINIYGHNRMGLLADIVRVFQENEIEMQEIHASKPNRNGIVTLKIAFDIRGRDELNRFMNKLRQVESIIDIERTTG